MIDLITIRLIWNSYDFNHAIKEEGGGCNSSLQKHQFLLYSGLNILTNYKKKYSCHKFGGIKPTTYKA